MVVLHNLRRVVVGDGLDEVAQLGAGFGLQLEDLLQATRGDEGSARGNVVEQDLGKLVDHVLEHVLGRVVQQRLERGQVDALLDDGLERALGLGLEVLRARLVQVDREQLGQRIGVGECLGVVGRVPAVGLGLGLGLGLGSGLGLGLGLA